MVLFMVTDKKYCIQVLDFFSMTLISAQETKISHCCKLDSQHHYSTASNVFIFPVEFFPYSCLHFLSFFLSMSVINLLCLSALGIWEIECGEPAGFGVIWRWGPRQKGYNERVHHSWIIAYTLGPSSAQIETSTFSSNWSITPSEQSFCSETPWITIFEGFLFSRSVICYLSWALASLFCLLQ